MEKKYFIQMKITSPGDSRVNLHCQLLVLMAWRISRDMDTEGHILVDPSDHFVQRDSSAAPVRAQLLAGIR